MKKKNIFLLIGLCLLLLLGVWKFGLSQSQKKENFGLSQTLPEEVVLSLEKALKDEYKARDTYQKVLDKFGSVRPFSMIIRAEEQHIQSLLSLYGKYNLELPQITPIAELTEINSLAEACGVGAEAEIANATMYRDDLLPKVSSHEDISLVFDRLMNASTQKHLRAFERCSS